MNKVLIRCLPKENYRPAKKKVDLLYLTFPDCGHGYTLITCTSCGEIYAINIESELYQKPPLKEKLQTIYCQKCNKLLSATYADYPKTFVSDDGELLHFDELVEYPEEKDTILKEFYSVY